MFIYSIDVACPQNIELTGIRNCTGTVYWGAVRYHTLLDNVFYGVTEQKNFDSNSLKIHDDIVNNIRVK